MTPAAATPLRAAWLLIRLRLQRLLNVSGVALRFKRGKPNGASRAATPGKRTSRSIVGVLLAIPLLLSFGHLARGSVFNLHCQLDALATCQVQDSIDTVLPQLMAGPFSAALLGGLTFLLCLLSLVSVLLPLGSGELARPDWDLEWLVTLPASKTTLLWARVLERSVVNPTGLISLLPTTTVIAWYGGYGWLAPLPAVLLSLLLLLLAAMLRTLVDTGLRLSLAPSSLGNLQAMISIVGVIPMYLAMSFGMSQTGFTLGWAATTPAWSAWTPPGLVVQLLTTPSVAAAAALLLQTLLFLLAGMAILQRQLRHGVVGAGQRESVRLLRKAAAPLQQSHRWRLGTVIQRRELSLLKRDRNFMVQTLLLPLVLIGSQLVFSGKLHDVHALLSHTTMLASTGFFLGAYILMTSVFQTLNKEGAALWLLYTFPLPVEQALRQKAQLWAALAMLYPLVLFGAALFWTPHWQWDMIGMMLLALAGIPLYCVIAVALGVFGSDPLATEAAAKLRPSYLYLYLLLTGLYIGALSAGSVAQKLVFIVLTAALALALWQKARDAIPYLLDPAATPPARVSASDGLIAAMLFFVLQVLILLLLKGKGAPTLLQIALAFGIAGALTYLLVRLLYWRGKTAGVPRISGGKQTLRWGATGAAVATICGIVYLFTLRTLGQLPAAPLLHTVSWDWLWLAGLMVLAAPLCEEFMFRGLIQGGLRRSLPAWQAIAMSAAIFAIVHPPAAMLPVFVVGLCTGWAYERSGSLLAPMLVHAGYNAAILSCQLLWAS